MRIWRRGLAMALAAVLAGGLTLPSFLGLRSLTASLGVAVPTFIGLWSGEAEARRGGGGGSGGYSRPGGSLSRTPSFSGGAGSSGGYFRSSPSTPSRTPSLSTSDRDASRAASRQGLNAFQAQQTPAPSQTSTPSQTPSSGFRVPRQAPAYAQPSIPPAYAGPSRFGMWDAAMLFLLLNSLSTPSHAAFFHHHAEDPNYLAWRAEADKMAATDPELKAKLAEVDRTVVAQANKPREAGYVPPDLVEQTSESSGFSWGTVLFVVLAGGAAYWFFVRRKPQTVSKETEMGSTPFALGKSILQGKIAKPSAYRPDYLRLGMGVRVDPSPFILLGPTSHVPRPTHSGDRATVTALSMLVAPGDEPEAARQAWLYLSDTSFVEVALAANGQPESARYFAKIDEVYPANSEEWGFWLAKEEGMIGWPEFQTKDGHVYARHWLPGDCWIPPRRLLETRERADGESARTVSTMLYARDTGQQPPAPDTEYLLVLAAETANEAWVELYLGIDLPLSSLGLS